MKFIHFFNSLFFTLVFFVGFLFYVGIYGEIVYLIYLIKLKKNKKEALEFLKKRAVVFSKATFKFTNCPVNLIGKENIPDNGPYVIVGNHQSLMDGPLVIGFIAPVIFILKKQNMKVPFISKFFKALDFIPVDRDDPRSGAITLRTFAKELKVNKSIISVFPEGTRTNNGEVGKFKEGSLSVPYKFNIQILPIVIDGTFNMMKKNRLLLNPTKINLKVLKPLQPKDFESEKILSDYIRDLIIKNKNNL
ncbi:1-acyl-sn-glycerol-3-phosphate acyltransferase [Tepiditoga spiralis]|uniref:1-acyl-sn-glycerol-3-phosphate acyltransferase n=1 Tax=Tepiditoga spiralis TaxID=2108365 RepID=A0A7G1G5R7_9BACT|nr:lysophospholipid acyltransferase family protein [Tepiditoga spiralis]BBE31940.1 1-acyl-sn-glycerol-3-phosphate acyltransferase [Tepiditoga spiralis]